MIAGSGNRRRPALRSGMAGVGLLLALAGCAPKPHVYVAEPMAGSWRIAVLPFANYAANRDAGDRVLPIVAVALAQKPGVTVVDQGEVDAALAKEPWLILDRIPPDIVKSIGTEVKADALLTGSLLSYTERDFEMERIPQTSLSLRLIEVNSGRLLWNAVHSRDGGDEEWLFGLGRVQSMEQLLTLTVGEMLETFPTGQGSQ